MGRSEEDGTGNRYDQDMDKIKTEPKATSTGPAKYGDFYWCVKTPLAEDGEIYVFADQATIRDGVLTLSRRKAEDAQPNLVLAPGHWTCCFAASCLDGSAVAVEHWKGEVSR